MTIRKLLAILVAIAVLAAPSVTSTAMAASAHDQMQMMEAGHCHMPAAPTERGKADGKSCCIAMCTAIAVAPSPAAEALPPRREMPQFMSAKAYHGVPAEIATPPPRDF